MSENVRLTRTKWGTPYGIRDNNGYLFFFHDITCFEGQEDRFIKESKEREQLCTDLVGFLSNRSTLTQQEQEIARLTEELAWSENAWKNAEAELRRNGIDGEGIVDALISGFNMVYTSPAWSGDERTPEGWKKKEKAIRKAFTATIKKAITLFMVFLEFAKERVRVAEDCLDIKKKEVELLRAEVERLTRERDEWKGKAEEAEKWVSDLQSGMYVNCVYCGYRYGPKGEIQESMADILKAHVEKCPKHPMSLLTREYAKAKEALPILQELLDTHNEANPWLGVVAAATLRTNELSALRRESVRVDVLLRYRDHIYRRMRANGASGETSEEVAAYRLYDALTRRSLRKEGE